MTDILCPTDLSGASLVAAHVAADLARHMNASVTLLHVLDKASARDGGEASREALDAFRGRIGTQVTMRLMLREGDFLKEIASESARHALMVGGTHGAQGLRQSLFGADILKLVRRAAVPSLVVQEHSPTVLGDGPIVMPVAGHADIGRLLDTVCRLTRLKNCTVQVYQIMRPGEEPSGQLLENKKKMLFRLADEGLAHEEVNEPLSGFSAGFAQQTIAHATKANAMCMAIMAHASDDYRWLADAEKERLLANATGIPVLCC